MTDLTIVILAYNEAKHVRRAVEAGIELGAKVFVVDSFSKDDTADIAASAGATVVQHPFINYARQYQWALDTLPISSSWVMRLDADETMTAALVEEIRTRLPTLPADVTGVNLKRRHVFLGRWIRHGGRYPLVLMRIWRKGAARIEQRWMDEHMVLLQGRSITFQHDFSDENLEDVTFFIDKHNKYATREAIDVLSQKYHLEQEDDAILSGTASAQATSKRLLKQRIYNRLPLWMGPLSYFLLRYIVQLGFLDGKQGLIYHFLQGAWYRFLVAIKVWEFDRTLSRLAGRYDRLEALEKLTGHRIGTTPAH